MCPLHPHPTLFNPPHLVSGPEVDGKEFVPILLRKLLKRARADEAGVRNQDMCATELVQRDLDDAFAIFRRGDRSDGLATSYPTNLSAQDRGGSTWQKLYPL